MSDQYDVMSDLVNRSRPTRRGYVASGGVSANSYTDVPVTFSPAFSDGSAPQVIASLYSSGTSGILGNVSVSAIDVTNTGFTMRFFNGSGSNVTPGAYWFATGVKP